MGLGFAGDVLGFQSGGIPDDYKSPDVFDIQGTKGGVSALLSLYQDMIKGASGPGQENRFLRDTFQQEMSSFLVPFRARAQSSRTRLMEDLIKRGVTDPVAIARLMAEQDRGFASQESQGMREIGVGQARRYEEYPFKVGTLVAPFLSDQQRSLVGEAHYGYEADVKRQQAKLAQRQANAAAFRRLAGAGFNMAAGMGGMDPESLGFMGGGFLNSFGGPGGFGGSGGPDF